MCGTREILVLLEEHYPTKEGGPIHCITLEPSPYGWDNTITIRVVVEDKIHKFWIAEEYLLDSPYLVMHQIIESVNRSLGPEI